MQDNDFDKHIRAALEEYEDTTPVALGWERFQATQAPAVGVVGIKRWLTGSVIINLLLVGAVAWLWWSFVDLKERLSKLESSTPTDQQVATGTGGETKLHETDTDNTTPSGPSLAENRQPAVSVAVPAALRLTSTRADSVTQASAGLPYQRPPIPDVRHFDYPFKPLDQTLEGIALPPTASPIAVATAQDKNAARADGQKKSETPGLSLSTVVALEKNRMGNKIVWQYGISGNYGFAGFGEGLSGTNAGGGASIEALVHPLLGLETGISFQQFNLNTSDPTIALREWEKTTGSPSSEAIEELSARTHAFEVPLMLKLRLPKSDRSYWFGSAGIVQSIGLSKFQSFEVLRLETEDGETEYEDVDVDFRHTKASWLYTGLAGELGFSQHLFEWPLQWHVSVYYKNSLLRNPQDAGKVNLTGLKAGIWF